MSKSLYTLITQLENAHFTNDNASFESIMLSIIRTVAADSSKLAQKNSLEMAKLLKEHQAGLLSSAYTRNISQNSDGFDGGFYTVIEPTTQLEDLVLPTKINDQVQSIILSQKKQEMLRANKIPTISKVIISGKPGTGKSSLAAAIANALDVPILVIRVPLLFSSYLGDSGRNILRMFKQIESKNAVILFDEFDSLATSRVGKNDIGEMRRVVNTVLTLLDEWKGYGLIIATTNNDQDLDDAIWRRFELAISTPLPQYEERLRLWQKFSQSKLTRQQLEIVSYASEDWSPADIRLLSEQSLREYVLKSKPVFKTIASQLSWVDTKRSMRKDLLIALRAADPMLTTRELSEIVGFSKSTVQRDLMN